MRRNKKALKHMKDKMKNEKKKEEKSRTVVFNTILIAF